MKPNLSVYKMFNAVSEAGFQLGELAKSIFDLAIPVWETQYILQPEPNGTYQLVIKNSASDSIVKVIDKIPEDIVFESDIAISDKAYMFLHNIKIREESDARLREIAHALSVLNSNKKYLDKDSINTALDIHYDDKRMRYLQQVLSNGPK